MRVNSVSGFVCYVKDLNKTAEFYEKLGFRAGKRSDERITFYVNWFSIDFVAIDKEDKPKFTEDARSTNKGMGIYINVKVNDVDEFYKEVLDAKMKPSSEPRDWPWGNREFVLRDPDGYKLVFFQKK